MSRTAGGFTLIELIVVVAVMSLMVGTMVPLLSATQAAERIAVVEDELETIAEALEAYYFDQGSFPASLDADGFYGTYVLPGVNDGAIRDEWGGEQLYLVVRGSSPDTITVYSVGENGVDDGAANEEFKVAVAGAAAGNRRTRQRMAVIAAVYTNYLNGGGTLSGDWSKDRVTLGLGPEYRADGFGTDFVLSPSTHVLRSAGADRRMNTGDDLVL